MTQGQEASPFYLCPMHPEVRQATPGKCPNCGMALLPEGTKFRMLRHISRRPLMVIIMVAVMVAVMAAIMMMR